MDQVVCAAPAKINLTLDILRRRADGYHDLRMVMQSVSLCDTVRVTRCSDGEIRVRCGGSGLPEGPENIAWKAAHAFFHAVGAADAGAVIEIEKRIPVCAGMAGGSADGAAVLRALRQLCRPQLPDAELERIGAAVGSDVPFCVRGGAALAEGRGEILTTLPGLPECEIVICKPEFGISTPELYGRVRTEKLRRHPDTQAMRDALAAGDLPAAAAAVCNVFEEVLAPDERRDIARIEEALRRGGALSAAMTGSGPTVFGLFDRREAAELAARTLRAEYRQTYLARPLGRTE